MGDRPTGSLTMGDRLWLTDDESVVWMDSTNPSGEPARLLAPGHAFEAFDWRAVTQEGADWGMEMEVTARGVNSSGALQGGLLATLIDSVAGMSLMPGVVEADFTGPRPVTSEMQVSFLAAA